MAADTNAFTRDAMIEAGSFGLSGKLKQLGNATGMLIVVVFCFILLAWVQASHKETMGVMRDINDQGRRSNDALLKVIDKNSAAIDNLAGEVRKLREHR